MRIVKEHSGQYSARVVSLAPRAEDKEAIVLCGYDYAWAGQETQWDLRKLHSEKRFQGVGYMFSITADSAGSNTGSESGSSGEARIFGSC